MATKGHVSTIPHGTLVALASRRLRLSQEYERFGAPHIPPFYAAKNLLQVFENIVPDSLRAGLVWCRWD